MDANTEKNENKKRSVQHKLTRPLKHRALALLLALMMILTSSGIQAAGLTENITDEQGLSVVSEQAESLEDETDSTDATIITNDIAVTDTTEATDTSEAADSADVAVDDSQIPAADTNDTADISSEEFADEVADIAETEETVSQAEPAAGSFDMEFETDTKNDAASVKPTGVVDSDGNLNITNLMTKDDSYIMVQLETDGPFYTLEELDEKQLKVPKGATILAHLEWDVITGIEAGQNLVYQIPKDMVTGVVEEERFMFSDNHDTFAGYMSLSSDGLFKVEIDSNYFKTWSKKQGTSTLELDYLTLEFYGSLSSEHGEHSGGDDAKIVFKGETEAEPKSAVEFEIPFEYKNENSPVYVKKEGKFDAANQAIKYTVTVSTPKSNSMTSENVKLTDAFDSTTYLTSGSSGVYQDVTATLYTNTNDGTSLENGTDISAIFAPNRAGNGILDIGNMEPDSVVVLTYTVKLTDKYFASTSYPQINNTALATYNDITSPVGNNSDSSTVTSGGSVKVEKLVGNLSADSNGNAYIQYTLRVTAQGGAVSDIHVKDEFTQNGDAIKEVKDFSDANNVVIDSANKSFTWNIAKLDDKKTTTMTYKAYLDPDYWDLASTTINNNAVQKSLRIKNWAGVYVGDSDELYGSSTTTKDLTKTWLVKNGVKNSDGTVTYTVKVNSDPTSDDITSIYDNLSTDGATIQYPITLNVYKSSSNQIKVGDGTYTLNQGDPGFTSSSTGWNLNLEQYNSALKGSYYYVVTYKVNTGGAAQVSNGAGINRGNGVVYGEGTTVDTVTINANKKFTFVDYVNGYISWESTMRTSVDAGAVYYDNLDDDQVEAGTWWFTLDQINGVEVYLTTTDSSGTKIKDEVIYSLAQGVNTKNISVDVWDYKRDNPYARQPVAIKNNSTGASLGNGYYGFLIRFPQAITLEKNQYISIRYNTSNCVDNMYLKSLTVWCQNHSTEYIKAGGVCSETALTIKNSWKWVLGCGVSKDSGWGDENGDQTKITYDIIKSVMKGSSYDADTGIITWKIYLNRHGDMIGDATVVDTLPEGLDFVSAELGYDLSDAQDYMGTSFCTNTTNNTSSTQKGNIKENGISTEPQADGTTKVTVELENLKGYSFNDYNEDGTVTENNHTTAKNGNWYQDGVVVLTIKTRISDTLLLQGLDEEFKNTVTVTNATMACGSATATATQEVKLASEDNLKKDMVNYTGGTKLNFTLDINSNGYDLISTEGAPLVIDDEMSSKMSLATSKQDYFVVKDKDGNRLTEAASADIGENQYYVTEVDGAADKTTYRIIVPDEMALTINYWVTVDAAVGEKPDVTNKAYFVYEGQQQDKTVKSAGGTITISKAKGTSGTSADMPSFRIYKQDQWGSPVEGVTFELDKVTLDSNGKAAQESLVKKMTTDSTGYVTFSDLNDLEKEDAIYCFYETDVPTGYEKSEKKTYFYFFAKDNMNIDGAIGIDYNDKVFTVTNQFKPASLTVPVKKTINNEEQSSDSEFGFTLKKTTGSDVYSDEKCTTAVTSAKASINGSGTTKVDTLYFNTPGTYEFTLTEDALTQDEVKEGFTKSDVEYTITAVVENSDKGLSMKSATYSWTDADGKTQTGDLLNNGTPAFNNTLTLEDVTVTLNATKKLVGDVANRDAIQADEFTFKVVENGTVIAIGKTTTGSKTANTSTSAIEFKGIQYPEGTEYTEGMEDDPNIGITYTDGITYTQNDLGTHVLTIYEVADPDNITIAYSEVVFYATVKVEPVKGENKLTATVSYSTKDPTNLNEDKEPVFTNTFTYTAEGEISLTAKKKLLQKNTNEELDLKADEFSFEVYDGTKKVAEGKNDVNGTIKFSKIKYDLSDLGEHKYTVKEVKGDEMFVEYSTTEYEVTVKVTDAGSGKLNAVVTSVNGVDATTANYPLLFENYYTFVLTGINLDILPYILIVVLAAGFGVLMLMRRRKRI
jgi:pilin isopeptide linkage protein